MPLSVQSVMWCHTSFASQSKTQAEEIRGLLKHTFRDKHVCQKREHLKHACYLKDKVFKNLYRCILFSILQDGRQMFFVPESSACLHFSKIYNLENVLDAAPYPNNYMVEIAA